MASAGEEKYCYREVVPFMGMVIMEVIDVGLNTLFKAATTKGMSYLVFIFYTNAISALLLLPSPFFSHIHTHRSTVLPPLTSSVLSKIGLLGLIGGLSQTMGYRGIKFSSPTLASAISNLTPAFTFILAIIFRMEKVTLTRTSSQAKILGTIVSVIGALVVTLYKGPAIIQPPSLSILFQQPLHSANSNWIIGGILLTAEYLLIPFWYIVQTQIMKEYPNEFTVVFFYSLCISIIAAIVGLLTEGFSSAWRLRMDMSLASIVCSGIFASCMSNTVCTWALRIKGPLYVAMFKPLLMVIAVVMCVLFLGDSLHLGSLVGATIISAGFYTVMWGKSKEDMVENYEVGGSSESSSTGEVPLLQSYATENA